MDDAMKLACILARFVRGGHSWVEKDLAKVLAEVKLALLEARSVQTDASWGDEMCLLGSALERHFKLEYGSKTKRGLSPTR